MITSPAERIGLLLAMSLAVPAVSGAVALALGVPLSPMVAAAGLVATVAWLRPAFGTRRETLVSVVSATAIIAVALGLASLQFDLSYDGQTYHQVGIRRLADGWNPVWAARAAESFPNGMHVFSLPKGAWIVQALIYQATGSLESAKGTHLIALVAAVLLGGAALRRLGVPRRRAFAVAIAAAAGPVTVPQLFTFYLDGLVASSLLVVLALLVLHFSDDASPYAMPIAVCTAFLVNLKFTALVYAAAIAVVTLMVVIRRRPTRRRSAAALLTACAALALAAGVNPYVTNAIVHGHPAYPVAGPDAIQYKQLVHRDSAFMGRPAPEQLARAIFGVATDDSYAPPRLKPPFVMRAQELAAFTTVDTRIGGWGPLFSTALLIGWALIALAWRRGDPRAPWLAVLSGAALASALLVPTGFYARYTPQVWLACLPALLLADPHRWRVRVLGVIIGVNLLIVGGVSFGAQLLVERLHRRQLREIAAAARDGGVTVTQREAPFVNVDLHLDAFGIRHAVADSTACAAPAQLLKTHAWVCLAGGGDPPPAPDPIEAVRPLLATLGIKPGYR